MLNTSLLFSKFCFVNIRDIRRIRNMVDHTTASITATSLIHSKIDYCKSLVLNLSATLIENSMKGSLSLSRSLSYSQFLKTGHPS